MGTVEAGIRICGECGNLDRYGIDGKPVGTIKLDIGGESQEVRQGVCRAKGGLSLGIRAEIAKCVYPEFRDKLISRAEAQPEGVIA